MGKYTKYKCKRIDAEIGSQLTLISDAILRNIPSVQSIILAGGFGKGEGSVEITQDGKVECLRDFDIVVIVDRIPKEEIQRKLHDEIYTSLGLANPRSQIFRYASFVVKVHFRRKSDLIYPDVWFYDLKAASQILYGEDVRNLIPWSKNDVPLSSGIRILFEKVCGLLGVFSYSYLEVEKLPAQQEKLLIFECYKTFIEICTVLSILANRYEPKYTTRARNLENFCFEEFPDLVQSFPELPEKVRSYTAFKLRPNFAKIDERPVELWFSARECLSASFSLCLKRYLGVTLSNWKDLPDSMKRLARQYYKPFLGPLMNARLRFSNRLMLDMANFLYQTLVNMEYSYVVTSNMSRLYLRPLLRCYMSPSLKFFQAGIMILFSLNRDGTVEESLLEKAANELSHCIPIDVPTFDASGWEILRMHFLKAYSLFEGYHFVR